MKPRSISIHKQPSLPSFAHHDLDTAISESWLPWHLQEKDKRPISFLQMQLEMKPAWNVNCMVWEEATAALGGIRVQTAHTQSHMARRWNYNLSNGPFWSSFIASISTIVHTYLRLGCMGERRRGPSSSQEVTVLVGDTALTYAFAECLLTCLASVWSRNELWMDQMKVCVLFCCWKVSARLVTVCGERQRRMQRPALKMLYEELHTQKADLGLLQGSEGRYTHRCRMSTFWTNLTVNSERR